MVFSETAVLVAQVYSTNSVGDSIATETKRTVFVEFMSIGLKRKIDAMATGLNVEFKLLLKDIAEYDGEKVIEFRDQRYNIQNVYIRDDQVVELTVGKY